MRIIADGRGMEGKNPKTYRLAAREATTEPPVWLSDINLKVMSLCPEA
ncbi:hypothetical protein [Sphaerisporangium sp. NPDC051011]